MSFDWSSWWPVWSLALLGAYHGVNPGMGWLLAVGRGLQEKRRGAVLRSLLPIALGHEASIAVVVVAVSVLQFFASPLELRLLAALFLAGFAVYRLRRPMAHPRGFGARMGPAKMAGWSFLMSSAHGAGLMLVPLLFAWPAVTGGHTGGLADSDLTLATGALAGRAVLAATLHTLSMLVVMGAVALVVYEKLGLRLLRRAWFNLDLAWTVALLGAAAITLVT
jgi:hypothetical protein